MFKGEKLNPELARLREYCETVLAPRAREIDESSEFIRDVLKDMAAIGQQRLHLDGLEINWAPEAWHTVHQASQLIAGYSTATAVATSVARLHSYLLVKYAQPAVRDRWLESTLSADAFGSFGITEEFAGTDVRAMTTVATKVGGGYRLSGSKRWLGLAPVADYCIVLAKVNDDARAANTVAVVVELNQDGVNRYIERPLSGLRGMANGGLDFDDVFVSENATLNCDGFMGMMDGLNMARIEAASYSCGLILRSIELSVERSAERVIQHEPLLRKQITQQRIGQMYGDYLVAETMTRRAVDTFAEGNGGNATLISAAKLFATDKARLHTDAAMQLWGAQGLLMHSDVERMHRDAKVMQIFDGTSEIHQLMLGKYASRRFGQ